MLRLGLTALAVAWIAFGEGFTFAIGSPVASQDFHSKTAAFVLRTEGCDEPEKAQLEGTAEGLVNGARRSVPLRLAPMSKAGAFAVFQTWDREGRWVVNLRGVCAGANAGAIVPMGPAGFIRESAKFFPRPATGVEIDTALKTLAQGENK